MAKVDEEKHGTWMTTMADLNTLLMVFFILLFSMLSGEKTRYQKLMDEPLAHGHPEGTEGTKVSPIAVGPAVQLLESYLESKNFARESVVNIDGQYTRFIRAQDEVRVVVGGEFEPFREGDSSLREQHYKILDAVYTWMRDRDNKIAIRGYTSRRFQDSLVKDPGVGWRPWRAPDAFAADPGDLESAADFRTLSYFRCREVADYLIKLGISPDRLVLQAEGAWGLRRADAEPPQVPKIDYPDDWDLPQRLKKLKEEEFRVYSEWQAKDRRVDIVIVDTERP